jgi:hypothetical protein
MFIIRRDLKEASSVAKVYKDYVIELWEINIKNPKNNKCILSDHEIGQWTDKNKDDLVKNVELKFIEELLRNIKNGSYE